jgi:positive regulator of sigma E activity
MNIQLADIWTATGVILGFQVTLFAWRVTREVTVGEQNDRTWLPAADIVNLISMVILVVGTLILPTLGLTDSKFMIHSFGLAVLLFVGYPFALAGHYEMYNNKTLRSYQYFPLEEKVVVTTISILAIAYVIGVIIV